MTRSRRELMGLTCAAALALLARPGPAAARGRPDADLLEGLLGIEQDASLLYGTLRATPEVPARLFRDQSRQHARGLETAVRNRGGRPPAPRARVGRAGVAQALLLETRAVGAYHSAAGELRDETLLPALASIMANHGQHQVVLRQALGRDPLPEAFATGAVR